MEVPLTDPYPDRAERDRRLLTYTTAPLAEDTEVTGHPIVRLFVRSTARDGAFIAYLEDVDPDGAVHYVTEGMLRALHRATDDAASPTGPPIPHRSFLRADAREMEPGETTELRFDLQPTSYRFAHGHAIRLALAGADADHFARIPESGPPPTVRFFRDRVRASWIELPVVVTPAKGR
ncbi:MAG: CocE/NonD family hydrolase, partial [Myxococcales bacterium]|nr:CocE/NonD family hydrolase [Myxococcales bacterium]